MKRSPLLLAVAAIGAVVLVVAISSLAPKPADTGLLKPDDVQVTALGRQVYATHCAACHGAKLEASQTGARETLKAACRHRRTMRPGTRGTIPTRRSCVSRSSALPRRPIWRLTSLRCLRTRVS